MARLITEERRVLTGSLHTVPDIHRLFNFHKCDWMARDPGTYREEMFETQVAPTALVDDTVLDALFSGTAEEGLAQTHAKGKRHRSHRTEKEKAHKRQRRQEKEARRASIADEELRQQRVRERVVGASSSAPVVEVQPVLRDVVSTTNGTEGAMIADMGTTEGALLLFQRAPGNQTPLLVDDSPALCATGLLHPIHFLLLFLYALWTIASIFVGGGVNGL
uniref:Integrase core domain containing protein n=1 Tax=Solanum tuberosum TaxID=4113 RepID=M1DR80_SOLTU